MAPHDAAFSRPLACGLLALALASAGCAMSASAPAGPSVPAATPPSSATADDDDSTAEAEPRSNTLRWTTASEVDNFGFDVYRALAEDGPFEKLTERPIAGAGTADVPTEYAYVDETIEGGREYFYYVESISMSGERKRFTPVIRAAPKP